MSALNNDIQSANPLVNFIDMIAAPGQALRRVSLVNQRSWWFPALLALAAAILNLWVSIDQRTELAKRQIEIQISNLPPEQVEAARPMMERFSQPSTLLLTGIATITIGLVLAWLLSTLIVYLSAAIAGANPKLNNLWPAVVWTWEPFIFRELLQATLTLITGRIVLYPGLGFLITSGDTVADAADPMFMAASQIDLFSLWHVFLIYKLMRAVAGLGTSSSLAIAIVYAAINIGLRMIPMLIGSALQP